MRNRHVAGTVPVWHRIGRSTQGAESSGAALHMAQLDWQVREQALWANVGDGMRAVSSHKAIVRCDSEEVVGVVGRRWTPVQNAQAFRWLDELVGAGSVRHEYAGCTRSGALVWALVRLPVELRIAGTDDIVHPFILVCNSHDGSVAFRAVNTSVRVVCSNAITHALRQAGPDRVTVKHTQSVHERLADAQAVLGASIERHRRLEVQINALARRKFTARDFTEFLDGVLGASPKSDDHPDGEPTAARMRIAANFDHELQRLRGIEHSAWAAFNAVSQYVDWERPTRGGNGRAGDERRFQSALLGPGAELKRRAFALAASMAAGGR